MRAPHSVQYSSRPAGQPSPDRLPRLLPAGFAAGPARPAWLTTSPGTGQHRQAA